MCQEEVGVECNRKGGVVCNRYQNKNIAMVIVLLEPVDLHNNVEMLSRVILSAIATTYFMKRFDSLFSLCEEEL